MVYFPGIGRALVERGAQIRCGAVKGMRIVTASIGYLDLNCEQQQVDRARLPRSFEIATNSATLAGNVVAQGDSDGIGCRIVVHGVVKAEKIRTK
jgi:Mycobacterium membrane protein